MAHKAVQSGHNLNKAFGAVSSETNAFSYAQDCHGKRISTTQSSKHTAHILSRKLVSGFDFSVVFSCRSLHLENTAVKACLRRY